MLLEAEKAAAVAANLRYVLERLESGAPLPEDGLLSLQDAPRRKRGRTRPAAWIVLDEQRRRS